MPIRDPEAEPAPEPEDVDEASAEVPSDEERGVKGPPAATNPDEVVDNPAVCRPTLLTAVQILTMLLVSDLLFNAFSCPTHFFWFASSRLRTLHSYRPGDPGRLQ